MNAKMGAQLQLKIMVQNLKKLEINLNISQHLFSCSNSKTQHQKGALMP
ncbi:MAG: hypothetical protein PHO52_04530 [Sulfuricurvum sp.]|nr:hypothetical protein [Sulfuricurvum sp.]